MLFAFLRIIIKVTFDFGQKIAFLAPMLLTYCLFYVLIILKNCILKLNEIMLSLVICIMSFIWYLTTLFFKQNKKFVDVITY